MAGARFECRFTGLAFQVQRHALFLFHARKISLASLAQELLRRTARQRRSALYELLHLRVIRPFTGLVPLIENLGFQRLRFIGQ
ncbi:hypothetical protein D3C78_1878290 [compost metagenome]